MYAKYESRVDPSESGGKNFTFGIGNLSHTSNLIVDFTEGVSVNFRDLAPNFVHIEDGIARHLQSHAEPKFQMSPPTLCRAGCITIELCKNVAFIN